MNTYGPARKFLIIIMIVIGVLILASDSKGELVDDTFSPSGDITNIQIESGSADFKIVEGDSFFVKGENLEEDSYTFLQEGDTLIIEMNKQNLGSFHFGWFDEYPKVTVTIPRNIQFDTITINNGSGDFNVTTNLAAKQCDITLGSGDLDAEAIQADIFDSSIGSGDFEVKELNANIIDATVSSGDVVLGYVECDKMSMIVGSGDFTFKSLEARECDLELGSGDIEGKNVQVMNMTAQSGSGCIDLKGELTGVSEIVCGSGDIELNLDGDVEEYSFEINGSDIEVNGEDYGKNYTSDKVMDKQLRLQAGSGDIDVTIR